MERIRTGAFAAILGLFLLSLTAQAAQYRREIVATGFSRPVFVCAPPGDTSRIFVLEQHTGLIRIVNLSNNTVNATPFIDLNGHNTGNEQGVLGMAFHPDYASNGCFYVNFTTGSGGNHTEIARYTAIGTPSIATAADVNTKLLIMRYNQPESNHNGGWIGFGSDGLLYVASGDGGGANDQHGSIGNAQERTNLLGKILRVNVDADAFPSDANRNYAIPAGNPYAGHATFAPEIWAFGLRNPFRAGFDRANGNLWIGDVGQGAREEVDVIRATDAAPLNFGWRPREGLIANPSLSEIPVTTATDPVRDYPRGSGTTVIGGYVYRGPAIPSLQGTYFHADYGSNRVWTFTYDGSAMQNLTEVTATLNAGVGSSLSGISSFGEDANGEIYICELSAGRISRIIPDLSITSASPLPAWTRNHPGYSQNLAASGGTTPYTWSVESGSALPAGLSLSSGGVLSGTPSAAGNHAFTLRVTDNAGGFATKAFQLTVNAALSITTASPLPSGNVGTGYSQTLAASGGTGNRIWSVLSGALPDGLSLSAGGTLNGTPNTANAFVFTLRVQDDVGAQTTKQFNLTINASLTISTGSPLPEWTEDLPGYSRTFAAAGGAGGYAWVVLDPGNLPPGMGLSAGGVLSGTPTAAGTFNFNVQVTDAIAATANKAFTLAVNAALSITTASPLPQANYNAEYIQLFEASGGTGALSWTRTTGALPANTLLSSGGLLSGIPQSSGNHNFTIQVTDAVGATATMAFSLNVSNAPLITSTPLTHANLGTLYQYVVTGGGNPAPTYSLDSAPGVMTIDANSGLIEWTPPGAAAFSANVTVRASNGVNPDATQSFTIDVTDYGLDLRPASPAYLNMPATEAGAIPALLSQTGAFADTANLVPSAALVPYDVNSPLWSDGAHKRRWIALPSGQTAGFGATGNWTFPAGTVLVKHFELDLEDPGAPLRVEAESLALANYQTEAAAAASGGSLIRVPGSGTGTASGTFTGASGFYDVVAGYFDESDGVSHFEVRVGGVLLGQWDAALTDGGTAAEASSMRRHTVASAVSISNGAAIELSGVQHSGEYARWDYLEFVPRPDPLLRKRLETRLLVVKNSGVYGVTYRWRADHSDADLLPGSFSEDVTVALPGGGSRTQTWYYPSRNDCQTCHTPQAGHVLGVRTSQLNGSLRYPSTGVTDNQLRTWSHIGMLNQVLNEAAIPGMDRLVKVGDATAPLESRVRSYWAANCMMCHQPGGAQPPFDARIETPLANQHVVDEVLVAGSFGIDNARVVVGKDRWRSIMHHRMNLLGTGQMPPLARNRVDEEAVAVLAQWIDSLPGTAALAPPTISPDGGAFGNAVTVSLSHPDGSATIRYTLDGSDPTSGSPAYAGSFNLAANTSVRARAFRSGFVTSIARSAVFTIQPNQDPEIESAPWATPNPVYLE